MSETKIKLLLVDDDITMTDATQGWLDKCGDILTKRVQRQERHLMQVFVTTEPPAGGDPSAAGDPPAGDPPAGDPPAIDPPAGDPPAANWMDALGIPEDGRDAFKDVTAEQAREMLNGPVVPEKYEFTLPEGVEMESLDQDAYAGFNTMLSEMGQKYGLSQEALGEISTAATKFDVDRQAAASEGAMEAGKEAFNSELKAWKSEVGETKAQEAITGANRAIQGFMTPGLLKLLDDTGLNNSPDIINTFAAISAVIGEDSIPKLGKGTETPGSNREAQLNALYPSMQK